MIRDAIMRLLCWLGLHQWSEDREIGLYDMFPSPFDKKYRPPVRKCLRCPARQEWIPGYGGSEMGCWQ